MSNLPSVLNQCKAIQIGQSNLEQHPVLAQLLLLSIATSRILPMQSLAQTVPLAILATFLHPPTLLMIATLARSNRPLRLQLHRSLSYRKPIKASQSRVMVPLELLLSTLSFQCRVRHLCHHLQVWALIKRRRLLIIVLQLLSHQISTQHYLL